MAADLLPDPDSEFGARVRTRLRDERLIWLATTGADGTPQPNPVWFLWQDAATVLVYCQPSAHRLGHVAARPRVALNLDGDKAGGDIIVLAGAAAVDRSVRPAHENPQYVEKYGAAMAQVSGSVEQFGAAYSVPLVISVDRVRGH